MALLNRCGNILRQTVSVSKQMHINTLCMYHTKRYKANWKLFVGGVGKATNDANLKEAFSAYGKVRKAKVIIDRKTGKSRGFGFVTLADYESACYAIKEMDHWVLHGSSVIVRWAKDSGGYIMEPAGFGAVACDRDSDNNDNDNRDGVNSENSDGDNSEKSDGENSDKSDSESDTGDMKYVKVYIQPGVSP